jgi:hypothetical protein
MLQRTSLGVLATTAAAVAVLLVTAAPVDAGGETKHQLLTPDPMGTLGTVSTAGEIIDRDNPFFQSLGTNGRACVTCHVPNAAWTITPSEVRDRFARTEGRDPLFRTVDGANSPNADVSTEQARRTAYSMYTAQSLDNRAGALARNGAHGGPRALESQPFSIGNNDLVVQPTQPPTVVPPQPAMTLFAAWSATTQGSGAQHAVARGEALFNSRTFTISGVAGLNDALGMSQFRGTCSTCHNDPNIGNHSTTVPLNIGIADASRRTPDMPLYTLRNDATGQITQTTDPGRALITGKWADVGKFKGPILRGLAARAPYFHNGSTASLGDVVDFYNSRFNIGLTTQDRHDLEAFLSAL